MFLFEQRAVQAHGVARIADGASGRATLAVQSYAVRVDRCGLLRMGRHAVAAPRGSNEKVWPPCSFSNKEPSKTTVWLPCSGHVQEQKRLPPRLANDSNRGLQGRRLLWGFMLRACLCGVRARVDAGSCNEAHMTLRAWHETEPPLPFVLLCFYFALCF